MTITGTGFFTPVRKTPLPHQEEALQAVQSAFGEADRATLVMACGTGKTLVALWAAERLGAKSVLVLVPFPPGTRPSNAPRVA